MLKDWKAAADNPQIQGRQLHTQCAPGEVARCVLLPGDPGRAEFIAGLWNESHPVADNREYRTFTGRFGRAPLSVTSTGIGGPSTAIAVEELGRIGADTFIRLGTCGAIQEDIPCGDVIINSAAVRRDGASNLYVEESYPASADYEVVLALVDACEDLGLTYHVGIGCSTGSFFCGQGRPGFNGYLPPSCRNVVDDMRRANVLNFEMEAASLFTLGNLYGFRTGCLCLVVANRITNQWRSVPFDGAVKACCRAAELLYQRDEEKRRAGKKYWTPRLSKSATQPQ